MGVKVITPPTLTSVVTIEDLRTHLRIAADGTEDELASAYLAAAHAAAEHFTGRPIGTQTREIALDAFPDCEVALGPAVTAIVSLKYIDAAGAEQAVSTASYTLDDYNDLECWLVPGVNVTWPATQACTNAVKVRVTAGDVPDAVRAALLLMAGWMFENRGDDARVSDDIQPPAAKALLNTKKAWGF